MINIPTVLVLGAGASRHCDYPLGQPLYDRIIDCLQNAESLDLSKLEKVDDFIRHRGDVQIALAGNYEKREIISFRESLKLADRSSIDKFLESRSDLIRIGKLCIAQSLIPYEQNSIRGQYNWYQSLFNEMDGKLEEFPYNKLSIVTFNYDRSLESYLFNALKAIHNITNDKEVAALLGSIPIVHVHGQLGFLPWQKNDPLCRDYGGALTQGGLIKASESIKIIYEDIANDPEIDKSRNLIKNAERVYFLGFGYDPINIRRLGVDQCLHNHFVGTGMGLTYNTRSKTMEEFQRLGKTITINDMDIINFFKVTRF